MDAQVLHLCREAFVRMQEQGRNVPAAQSSLMPQQS